MSESRSPDASVALERRYRRLLAWYSDEHPGVHGEEMIGVLLASAGGGRRRPGRPGMEVAPASPAAPAAADRGLIQD